MASLKIEIASLCTAAVAASLLGCILLCAYASFNARRAASDSKSQPAVALVVLISGRGSLTSSCLCAATWRRHMDLALGAGRCACRDTISMLERNDGVCSALAKHVVDHH